MRVVYKTLNGATRISDPADPNLYRIVMYVAAKDLPENLPSHGNPRKPNVERRLYAKVEESYLNPDNKLFHYQNRGIIVVAEDVLVSGDGREVAIEVSDNLEDKGGVVDGRHTETLLLGSIDKEAIRGARPDQPILVTILHGIKVADRTGVTVALNSTIPVSMLSNLNAQGFFESLKKSMFGSQVLDRIQFEQNGTGDKASSVAHLIEVMYTLRLDLFEGNLENSERGKHPSYVVTATRQKIHEAFPAEKAEYEKLYPILKDICTLYDTIEGVSHKLYQKQKKSSKAFQKGNYTTTWSGKTTDYILHRNAILPMISAFRQVIETDPVTGNYRWTIPFKQVIHLFCYMAGTWVTRITKNVDGVVEGGTNMVLISKLTEFAKDRDEWSRMYDDVELFRLKNPRILEREFRLVDLEPID